MGAQAEGGYSSRQLATRAAPLLVLAGAGLAVRTPVAAAYPLAALLLFLWVACDTMMLALLVRAGGRPDGRAVLTALAGASVTVWLASPAPLRATLSGTPVLAAGMALAVLGHVGWGAVRARHVLRAPAARFPARWTVVAGELLPLSLVRLAAAEMAVIHMALFRWAGPADVPANCRAFAYHRHLTPLCAALLALSTIEIAVYHLLIGHWSRTATVVLFVASDLGFVYLLGLVKSFRYRPVLATPDGVRIRTGYLIDHAIGLDAITAVETAITGDRMRDPATLNAALLAWPNVILQVDPPIARRSLWKRKRTVSSLAFRLDDPDPFVRLLRWRLGQTGG